MPFNGPAKHEQIFYVCLTAWQMKQCTEWIPKLQKYSKLPREKQGLELSSYSEPKVPRLSITLSPYDDNHIYCVLTIWYILYKHFFNKLTNLKSMIITGILQMQKRGTNKLNDLPTIHQLMSSRAETETRQCAYRPQLPRNECLQKANWGNVVWIQLRDCPPSFPVSAED